MKSKVKILKYFFRYLRVMNYSENTIKGYEIDLNMFFNFITEYKKWNSLEDINIFKINLIETNDIIAFLCYLANYRKCGSARRQRIKACLYTFYKWLNMKYPRLRNNVNPMENLEYTSTTKKIPKYIDLENAIKLQSIFTKDNCMYPERNNAIITMFLQTGLRVSELVSLNINDLNFNEKKFRVIGKGNKERVCYLSDNLITKLKIYFSTRTDTNKALFVERMDTRISIHTVQRICKKAYTIAGIDGFGYTTHTLRHTMATYMFKQTKDLLVVKELLGHASISSTEIYVHVINDEVKKAINNNPLSNFSPENYREEGRTNASTKTKNSNSKIVRCAS